MREWQNEYGCISCVYLIRLSDGNYKVGKTRHLRSRLRSLLREFHGAALVHIIRTNDIHSVEEYCLRLWTDRKATYRHEVFSLSEDDVRDFRSVSAIWYKPGGSSAALLKVPKVRKGRRPPTYGPAADAMADAALARLGEVPA